MIDYATNSHYPTYTKVGRMYFLSLGVKGLGIQPYWALPRSHTGTWLDFVPLWSGLFPAILWETPRSGRRACQHRSEWQRGHGGRRSYPQAFQRDARIFLARLRPTEMSSQPSYWRCSPYHGSTLTAWSLQNTRTTVRNLADNNTAKGAKFKS